MSGLSRRDLLFGRLFGRGAAEEPVVSEGPDADGAAEAAEAEGMELSVQDGPAPTDGEAMAPEAPAWARPERVPPPPWEREASEAAAPSPVAQVAPWELAQVSPGSRPPPSPRAARLGGPRMAPGGRRMLFSIQENLCLAYRSVPCSVCRERCPEPGAVVVQEGRPSIDPALCTACGDCIAVCPAPIMAIRMTPAPRPPAEGTPT